MATGTGGRQPGSAVVGLALPALTVTFGLQLLRLMVATMVSVERDRLGAPLASLGLFAVGVSVLAFLSPLVVRALGTRVALLLSAGGVGVVRLLLQLVPNAFARWLIAPVGVVLFFWFVPVYLAGVRGTGAGRLLGVGFLLGLALDTALSGVAGTYDYAWSINGGTVALAAVLAAAQLTLLGRLLASRDGARRPVRDRLPPGAPAGAALPLAGIGPALFLHTLVLQNIGWQTVLGRQTEPRAFLLVMLANLAAVAVGAALAAGRPVAPCWPVTLAAVAALALSVGLQASAGVAALFLGQVGVAALLVDVLRTAAIPGGRPGLGRTGAAWALGVLLLVLLVFVYYAAYDVNLPFDNKALFPLAAALLAAAGIGARVASWRSTAWAGGDGRALAAPLVAALLLYAPGVLWLGTPESFPSAPLGYPVRVMSYNLHFGYDVEGWSRLEETARTIQSSGAEVVGLEEVSRGWYINGSTDMLTWLQRRLRMPYVIFAGASDPIWGNAIMSRRPILSSGVEPLPRGGVPLRRNYVWAVIDLGEGQTIRVISTHLHHVEGAAGARVRLGQIPKVLAGWAGSPATVVMGDLNATPGSPEIALFERAGMVDAWSAARGARQDELTYASNRPVERIDYVWVSPDLGSSAFKATTSTASDHRGIAVTLSR
jgi:endonuclease/exonuclease/phosphatase family metal-dependent hydrolase